MKVLYLNFDENKQVDFMNTGHYLLRAAQRMGAPVTRAKRNPEDPQPKYNYVLNIEPCDYALKGTKRTGFYEIDYWYRPVNEGKWNMSDIVFSCDPYAQEKREEYKLSEKDYMLLPFGIDIDMVRESRKSPKNYSVAFIGRTGGPYDRRTAVLKILEEKIPNTFLTNAPFPTGEYMKLLAQGKVIFHHSLHDDCCRRFWDGIALGVLVCNRLPQFKTHPEYYPKEGKHFLAFESGNAEECVEKIGYILGHKKEFRKMAREGYKYLVKHHLYEERLKVILENML